MNIFALSSSLAFEAHIRFINDFLSLVSPGFVEHFWATHSESSY